MSASVISYFVPFLFMFAAMIKLQSVPAGAEVLRVPGGATVTVAVAAVGFATTAVSIVLAMVPSEQEVNKALAVLKIAGLSLLPLVLGIVTYAAGKKKSCFGKFLVFLRVFLSLWYFFRQRQPRSRQDRRES